MKNVITIFFFIIALHSQAKSQILTPEDAARTEISGTLKSLDGNPFEFATVVLGKQNDSSFKVILSDSTGHFIFTDIPFNIYTLKITGVGIFDTLISNIEISGDYKKKNIGIIQVSKKEATLKAITVTTRRPLIERVIDRIILNITSETALGNTAFDLLSKAPGVIVRPDEQITLFGKGGVKIYINDRPANMQGNELNSFLKSLNAEDVKQIEVITNPSAKYDAEGTSGIINIVLKKGYNRGLKTDLLTQYGQGVYYKSNSDVLISYSNDNINVLGTYGLEAKKTFESNTIGKNFMFNHVNSNFEGTNFIKTKSVNHSLRTAFDYKINKKNTIGFIVQKDFYKEVIPQSNSTLAKNQFNLIDSSFTTVSESNNRRNDFSLNGNYVLRLDSSGSSISSDLDYSTFSISSLSDYHSNYFNNIGNVYDSLKQKSDIPANVAISSAKVDLTQRLSKSIKLEAGFKASAVTNGSSINFNIYKNKTYRVDSTRTNSFNYKEQIFAGYFNVSKNFAKVSFQIGLRGEKTYTQGNSQTANTIIKRSYFNLFPSLFINYDVVPDKHNLAISYSRRIERPYYADLNPFIYYIDPYTYIQGNPYLTPQYTNACELSYTLKNKYSFTLFDNVANHVIIQTPQQNDTTKVTILQVQNLNKSLQLGTSMNVPVTIAKWWEVNNTLLFYKKNYTSAIQSADLHNSRFTLELFLTNTFKLPKGCIAELSGLYISPFVQGIYKTQSLYSVSASVKKKFMHERLGAKLSMDDVLKSYYVKNTIRFQNQNSTINQRFDTQIFRLTLTYNFIKGKNISSRERSQGNLDEQNRVK